MAVTGQLTGEGRDGGQTGLECPGALKSLQVAALVWTPTGPLLWTREEAVVGHRLREWRGGRARLWVFGVCLFLSLSTLCASVSSFSRNISVCWRNHPLCGTPCCVLAQPLAVPPAPLPVSPSVPETEPELEGALPVWPGAGSTSC